MSAWCFVLLLEILYKEEKKNVKKIIKKALHPFIPLPTSHSHFSSPFITTTHVIRIFVLGRGTKQLHLEGSVELQQVADFVAETIYVLHNL